MRAATNSPTVIVDVMLSGRETDTLLDVLHKRLDEIHAERERVMSVIRATEAASR